MWGYLLLMVVLGGFVLTDYIGVGLRVLLGIVWGVLALLGVGYVATAWNTPVAPSKSYADPKGRTRCQRCDKVVFRSVEEANVEARRIGSYGTYLRTYYENGCAIGITHRSALGRSDVA